VEREEIQTALDRASIAVLLVSPNFLASDFIATDEFPFLLSAAEKRGLRILWIAISSSLFELTRIAEYQAVNNPSKPLDSLRAARVNRELADIARKIIAAVKLRRRARSNDRTSEQEGVDNHKTSGRADALSLEEKLLRAARDAGAMPIISRMSRDTLGVYASSRDEVGQIGRISARKPPPVIEQASGQSYESMQLAGMLIAKAARSHRKIPEDVWPQLSDLPGIKVDEASFEVDGYDVIYRAWLMTASGRKEVWARVGTAPLSPSPSLEGKLLRAARDVGASLDYSSDE
jgi:hypothetical protein